FAAAELHLLAGQHDGLAAELAHGDVERYPRAGRRLVEDHRQHLSGDRERPGGAGARLHGAAVVDDAAQLAGGDVDEIEEMARLAHDFAPPATARSRWPSSILAAASSMRWTASAISGSSMTSGGSMRTTLSPAAAARSFSARRASTSSPFGQTARSPSNRPSPRTSAMTPGWRSRISARRWRNRIALRRTFSRNSGASTRSSTALPTAMARGLAPKVQPRVTVFRPLPASAVVRQAPTGNPPPSALAIPITSGVTPQR